MHAVSDPIASEQIFAANHNDNSLENAAMALLKECGYFQQDSQFGQVKLEDIPGGSAFLDALPNLKLIARLAEPHAEVTKATNHGGPSFHEGKPRRETPALVERDKELYDEVASLTSDGASMMRSTEHYRGVTGNGAVGLSLAALISADLKQQILTLHCICHQANLALGDALKRDDLLTDWIASMRALYKY